MLKILNKPRINVNKIELKLNQSKEMLNKKKKYKQIRHIINTKCVCTDRVTVAMFEAFSF